MSWKITSSCSLLSDTLASQSLEESWLCKASPGLPIPRKLIAWRRRLLELQKPPWDSTFCVVFCFVDEILRDIFRFCVNYRSDWCYSTAGSACATKTAAQHKPRFPRNETGELEAVLIVFARTLLLPLLAPRWTSSADTGPGPPEGEKIPARDQEVLRYFWLNPRIVITHLCRRPSNLLPEINLKYFFTSVKGLAIDQSRMQVSRSPARLNSNSRVEIQNRTSFCKSCTTQEYRN